MFYDHAEAPTGDPLYSPFLPMVDSKDLQLHPSRVWGPTCDGLDCVEREANLPSLREGDWRAVKPAVGPESP
jgi:diaminopimelate decarboxylase